MNILSLPEEMLSTVLRHSSHSLKTRLRLLNNVTDRVVKRNRLNMFCVGELRVHVRTLGPEPETRMNVGVCVSNVKLDCSGGVDRRKAFRNVEEIDIPKILHVYMKAMKEIKRLVLSGDSNFLLDRLLHCIMQYKTTIGEIRLENWSLEDFNCKGLRDCLWQFRPTAFHIDRCMGLDTVPFDQLFDGYYPQDVYISSRRLEVLEHLSLESVAKWCLFPNKQMNFHIHGITMFDCENITKFIEMFLPTRQSLFWQFGFISMQGRSKSAWVRQLRSCSALEGYEIQPGPLSQYEEYEPYREREFRTLTIYKFDKSVHNLIVIHFID